MQKIIKMKNKISDLKTGDQVVLMNGSVDKFLKIRTPCKGAILEKNGHIHDYQIDWEKTTELNNKQISAIDWLKKEMEKEYVLSKIAIELFKKAKKIEKELHKKEIIESYNKGVIDYIKSKNTDNES